MDASRGSEAAPGGEQLASIAHSAGEHGTGADAVGAVAADRVARLAPNEEASASAVLPCLDMTHLRSCTMCVPSRALAGRR
jgi:hypothetical protein